MEAVMVPVEKISVFSASSISIEMLAAARAPAFPETLSIVMSPLVDVTSGVVGSSSESRSTVLLSAMFPDAVIAAEKMLPSSVTVPAETETVPRMSEWSDSRAVVRAMLPYAFTCTAFRLAAVMSPLTIAGIFWVPVISIPVLAVTDPAVRAGSSASSLIYMEPVAALRSPVIPVEETMASEEMVSPSLPVDSTS